jgi:hypothetical protein
LNHNLLPPHWLQKRVTKLPLCPRCGQENLAVSPLSSQSKNAAAHHEEQASSISQNPTPLANTHTALNCRGKHGQDWELPSSTHLPFSWQRLYSVHGKSRIFGPLLFLPHFAHRLKVPLGRMQIEKIRLLPPPSTMIHQAGVSLQATISTSITSSGAQIFCPSVEQRMQSY